VAAGTGRSSVSLVVAVLTVVVVAAVGVLTTARVAGATLAVVMGAGAVVRAVRPEPGPVAVSVRSRRVDVVTLAVLAVALGVLTAGLDPS
jgi:hypothetical protein